MRRGEGFLGEKGGRQRKAETQLLALHTALREGTVLSLVSCQGCRHYIKNQLSISQFFYGVFCILDNAGNPSKIIKLESQHV